MLGPAHILTRRALAALDVDAVRFDSPARLRGRLPVGSDLHKPARLRQLLTWANPRLQPHLAIVMIDQDGDRGRRKLLDDIRETLLLQVVLAVSVQEFESWLLADRECLGEIVSSLGRGTSKPETLKRGEAKKRLANALSEEELDHAETRLRIVSECDLEVLAKRCPSFSRYMSDLKSAASAG